MGLLKRAASKIHEDDSGNRDDVVRARKLIRRPAPAILAIVFVAASLFAAVGGLALGGDGDSPSAGDRVGPGEAALAPAAAAPGASGGTAPTSEGAELVHAVGLYRVSDALPFGRKGASDPAGADLSRMTTASVPRVVDGDTVIVKIDAPTEGLAREERVRLIGVDAPEIAHGGKTADAGGQEAKAAAVKLLEGKSVRLAFDRDLRDRYGRILAYLYSPEGECLNRSLVASGAARALLKYPFAFSEAFEEAEKTARAARLGLWRMTP